MALYFAYASDLSVGFLFPFKNPAKPTGLLTKLSINFRLTMGVGHREFGSF